MLLRRRLAAEGLGTAALVATVVGSGIMAERLTSDAALALLCNTLPTGAMLVVLITVLGPISGAHLNPAVTTAFALRREIGAHDASLYIIAQLLGAIAGTAIAHLMFNLPILEPSQTTRMGGNLVFSEAVATFGLVAVILLGRISEPRSLPWLVGLYIVCAYWFTASTSFANPAVTLARSFTTSFAGIAIEHVPMFIVAQIVGALFGLAAAGALWPVRSAMEDHALRVG